jgi:hypothetical protein
MQIPGPVLERSGLRDRVAAALLEVLYTFTCRENSSWTVVGAYPVGFGDRGQHRLLGWVERFAPCFGAVSGPRDEHDRGRSFALALHVHLAAPAYVDQAGKILVIAEVAITGVAFSGVVGAPAFGEGRAGRSHQHHGHNRYQPHHLSQQTTSSFSCLRAFRWKAALVPGG